MRVSGHGQASKSVTGQLSQPGAVVAGTALYAYTVPIPSTAASTSLDSIIEAMLTDTHRSFDSIGITWGGREEDGNTDGPSMLIPPGWLWWATLRLRIDTVGSVVAGDTYYWEASTENGGQGLAFPDIAAAEEIGNVSNSLMGSSYIEGSLAEWGDITSVLGTDFKVRFVQLYAQGIQALAENSGPPPPSS